MSFIRRAPTTLTLNSLQRAQVNNSHSLGAEDEPFRVVSDVLSPAVGHSVVSLQIEVEAEQQLDDQLNAGPAEQLIIAPEEQPAPEIPEAPSSPEAPVADMDIPEGDLADDELPAPEELPAAVASAKKRGRPSATPAKTPGSAATTNGTASRATSGRKRKADDDEAAEEATPAKRPRGRPARGAAATASARLAAKGAKKSKAGRPKGSGTVCPLITRIYSNIYVVRSTNTCKGTKRNHEPQARRTQGRLQEGLLR